MPVKLLKFIESYANQLKSDDSRKRKNFSDHDRVFSSMSAYLDGNDVDLISLIHLDFLLGYGRFLFGGGYEQYKKAHNARGKFDNLSNNTLARHLRYLRAIARRAIADGLIPAIDIFQDVMASLKTEFNISDDDSTVILGKSNETARALPIHNFDAQADKIYGLLTDLNSKPKVKRAFPLLIYLLGIYAYGLEVEELLAIRWDSDKTAAVDDEITLVHPHLGIEVVLPERALRIVDLINKGFEKDTYLIHRRPDWQCKDIEHIAAEIKAEIIARFKFLSAALFLNNDIYTDWLCMLSEHGLDPELVSTLSRGNCDARSFNDVQQYADRLLSRHNIFKKKWFVLCSYSPGLDSTEMRAQITAYLKELGIKFDKAKESYDPQSIEKRLIRGKVIKRNSPTISRYLFVFCTDETARHLDKMRPEASFLRIIGERSRLANVSHRDVIDMVNFLKDFRDDVQLLDIAIPAGRNSFAEGVKVKILSGPFAGFEGTIAQVLKFKGHDTAKKNNGKNITGVQRFAAAEDKMHYQVEVEGFAMSDNAKVHVTGLDIELLEK